MHGSKNTPVIKIKDLSFAYEKDLILEDINLEIQKKDFMVFIGPNGGGKSTLIKLILGINPLQKGQIEFLGKPRDKSILHIGYVPQNTNVNLNFPIKALDVVMMGERSHANPLRDDKKKTKEHALKLLKDVGIKDLAQNKIGSLSGGQRQRVMIARALYTNPDILFLDEPTANIDADGQKQIYELLKKLNEKITIIVVSHDISILLEYASKVAHINKKLSFHDISSIKSIDTKSDHVCEVELLQMLGKCKC